MDDRVLGIIRHYLPEAVIEQSSDVGGAYKIRLPHPANSMAKYEDLRKALKDSDVKPVCASCHNSNTKFRYFDNNSSKVLQARYKCLEKQCGAHFTLGGKQYSKEQNAVEKAGMAKRKMEDVGTWQSVGPETKRFTLGSDNIVGSMNTSTNLFYETNVNHPRSLTILGPNSSQYYHQEEQQQFQQQQQYWNQITQPTINNSSISSHINISSNNIVVNPPQWASYIPQSHLFMNPQQNIPFRPPMRPASSVPSFRNRPYSFRPWEDNIYPRHALSRQYSSQLLVQPSMPMTTSFPMRNDNSFVPGGSRVEKQAEIHYSKEFPKGGLSEDLQLMLNSPDRESADISKIIFDDKK